MLLILMTWSTAQGADLAWDQLGIMWHSGYDSSPLGSPVSRHRPEELQLKSACPSCNFVHCDQGTTLVVAVHPDNLSTVEIRRVHDFEQPGHQRESQA